MNRRFLALAIVVALIPVITHAQIVITEIMYDLAGGSDSGREWIEVFNTGNTPVKLTDLKIVESAKNHTITTVAGGDFVAAGAYAVIADNAAKFKVDFPSYTGLSFDSAFSLSNTGETIGISNAAGTPIDSVTYTNASASGTGDSLQRNPDSAVFNAGIPTPGVGIPATGLTKSPPKQTKASKKMPGKNLPAATSPSILGESAAQPQEAFVAAAAASNTNTFVWWLAPLLISLLGSAGIVTARQYKKDEWDIVEEVEETPQ